VSLVVTSDSFAMSLIIISDSLAMSPGPTSDMSVSTCSYICSTDPQDVARVEGKTFICTKNKHTSVARSRAGAKGGLGLWLSPEEAKKEMDERWPGCMAGVLALTERTFTYFNSLYCPEKDFHHTTIDLVSNKLNIAHNRCVFKKLKDSFIISSIFNIH